jgi:hypothetical protein
MAEEKKKGFLIACKEYFGFLPGQKLSEFAAEMREVAPAFRKEIFAYFQKSGIVCEEPTT